MHKETVCVMGIPCDGQLCSLNHEKLLFHVNPGTGLFSDNSLQAFQPAGVGFLRWLCNSCMQKSYCHLIYRLVALTDHNLAIPFANFSQCDCFRWQLLSCCHWLILLLWAACFQARLPDVCGLWGCCYGGFASVYVGVMLESSSSPSWEPRQVLLTCCSWFVLPFLSRELLQ